MNFGKLWAGDESSFDFALTAVANALAYQASGKEMPRSELLTIEGNTGVVTIAGPLIPGEAGFMSFFGLVGYGDIRNAMIEAAQNPEIKSILLAMNSGGGAVDGCADCASLIASINAVKPVLTYADGSIGSAAYWLGSQASAVLIGPTTIAGSIGVILKHSEQSKLRANIGITDTVIRSGEFKQLANAVEPLSETGKAELQVLSDDIATVFVSAVADGRGMTTAAVESKMGKGREYVGKRAVSAGLADGIATYEGALSAARALQGVDNKTAPRQNARSPGAAMTKKTLSAADLAAIASGAVIEASDTQNVADNAAETAAAAAAAAAAVAAEGTDPAAIAAAAAAAAEAATTAAAATVAAGDAAAGAVAAETDLAKFLRGELTSAQGTILAQGIEIDKLKTTATAMADTFPKLLEIARTSVGKMKVALGGNAEAAATMSALEVITAHAETSALFLTKFKVGGAASTSAATETPADKLPQNVTPLFTATAKSLGKSK